jgi:chromosomal replication initiator protein
VLEVAAAVAADFGVTLGQLCSARRGRYVARPRQVAMLLTYELTGCSTPQIGRRLNRDHSTVLHGIAAVRRLMGEDEEFAVQVRSLRRALARRAADEAPAELQLDFLPGPLFDFAEARQ